MRTKAYAHRAYVCTTRTCVFTVRTCVCKTSTCVFTVRTCVRTQVMCVCMCIYTVRTCARTCVCTCVMRTRHIPSEPSDRRSEATATFIKVFLHKTTNSGDLKNTITFLTRRTIWKAGAKDVKVRHKCYEHSTPYQLNSSVKHLSLLN